jgi:hypothetical protein
VLDAFDDGTQLITRNLNGPPMMVYSRSPEPSQIEQSVSLGQLGRRDVVIVQLIAVRGSNDHTTPTLRRALGGMAPAIPVARSGRPRA